MQRDRKLQIRGNLLQLSLESKSAGITESWCKNIAKFQGNRLDQFSDDKKPKLKDTLCYVILCRLQARRVAKHRELCAEGRQGTHWL